MKMIAYKWHRDNSIGVIGNPKNRPAHEIIEEGQAVMREQGFNDAITFKVIEGNYIDGMIASAKL